jgi:hypothetical protein
MAIETNDITYNLDACALITLEAFYPHDLFPQIWEKLDELLKSKKAYVIEEVFNEIEKRDDDLYKWLRQRRSYAVKIQGEREFSKAKEILASHPGLVDINATQTSADPFVIADSVCCGSIIVTREERVGKEAKRPKIPNVATDYGAKSICGQYYATEFFRAIGWTF